MARWRWPKVVKIMVRVIVIVVMPAAAIPGCFLCASCYSEFLIDPNTFNLCNDTAGWVLLLFPF